MAELPQDLYELQLVRAQQEAELVKASSALAAARAHLHLELRRSSRGGADVDQALADADAAYLHEQNIRAGLGIIADHLRRHLADLDDARRARLRERGE